ncbi:MAG: hypothetical protein V4718_03030 [Pseudomonadota bacterium]
MQPQEGRHIVSVGNPGLVARLRQRLFPASAPGKPVSVPSAYGPDKIKAGIAELLLVNRLKARSTRKTQAKDVMERAAHIVFVTCKNWFTPTDGRSPERRTPL